MGVIAASASIVSQEIGRARSPDWTFTILTFTDSYEGQLRESVARTDGTRYVAAYVEVTNASDQLLPVSVGALRLRDRAGIAYAPVTPAGPEWMPVLADTTLSKSDAASGWVWFAVPTNSILVELAFVGPAARLGVPLPPAAS